MKLSEQQEYGLHWLQNGQFELKKRVRKQTIKSLLQHALIAIYVDGEGRTCEDVFVMTPAGREALAAKRGTL